MSQLFDVLQVALVIIGALAGCFYGFAIPLRLFGHRRAFQLGVMAAGIFSALVSLMCGHLIAGWTEELIGVNYLFVGLFIGCLLGGAVSNLIAGSLGLLVALTLGKLS